MLAAHNPNSPSTTEVAREILNDRHQGVFNPAGSNNHRYS